MERRIRSSDILQLLREKHSDALFVSECKDGPTHTRNHLRLDAWVMAKSWVHPCVWGYEIKVDRSDFLLDEKWRGYLPMCNQFYFVCPHKMIAPVEVPEGVGLMWVASTGTRLFTKVKAAHRDIVIPEDVYRYILMCRTHIDQNEIGSLKYWEGWLERNEWSKKVGKDVARNIAVLTQGRITEIEEQNRKLQHQIGLLSEVKELFEEMGINPEGAHWREVEKAKKAIGLRLLNTIKQTISILQRAVEVEEKTEGGTEMPRRHFIVAPSPERNE